MGEAQERLTIEESHGDSRWVATVPGFLRGMARGLDARGGRQRDLRMVRAVATLYPTLCQVERATHKGDGEEGGLLLDGTPFETAVNDDRAIERGLSVFDTAWASGAIALRAGNGKLIPPSRGKVIVPACGYSVDHVRHYFVDRAARLILRRSPKVYDRIVKDITDASKLPRLRYIASMQTLVINELIRGFEGNASKALFQTDEAMLDGLSRFRPAVMVALRESMDQEFPRLMGLDPEILKALADAFTVPEQARDIGPEVLQLSSPEAVHAVGAWDLHDITHRVNEERERRGLPPVKNPVYSTDIRTLRSVLGSEFGHLLERPAALLTVFGEAVRKLRDLDVAPRQACVEQMTLFCQRYIDYLTEEAVVSLFLLSPRDRANLPENRRPSIAEVFFIFEGLWNKKGFGRKFFENAVGSPEGAKALRLMMFDFNALKDRGSVKAAEDLAQITNNSDLLDTHIAKFTNSK
ncbi:hypothetical protein [uncultured Rhodospira sp.]|uniref:hypothetical protein n=1 Tax=uncultured Rhodospira sp. TaxID=1936189 RepID=UPI0026251F6D|nr:hypothetical protein [uncultured Rhodospira sp.]